MQKEYRFFQIKKQFCRENYKLLLRCLISAVCISLFVELLARRSPDDTVRFLVESPLLFLYGVLIVFFMLSISLLFKKRDFWFLLISAIWIGLAVTDFILLTYRSMPLTASDIFLMSSVKDIFEKYLSHTELLLLMLGISALLGIVVFLWVRSKKYPPCRWFASVHVFFLALAVIGTAALLYRGNLMDPPSRFDNLPRAYHDNGFVYSFSMSVVTGGVDEPDIYSPEEVEAIIDEQESLPPTDNKTPNIVFVQLESFFDPHYLKNIIPAENPVPNFTALKNDFPSGFLSVPAIGAGTANTEFEILTGMNLSHFGVGEYPYMTIVNHTLTESIASVLGNIGYQTHAIHNNNATFYDRNIVYGNLGFDSFTSLEYMDDVEYNPLGWAKDTVLTEEIVKALDATEEKDFIFTVSVQPHGKYPSKPITDAPTVKVVGFEDEAKKNGFSYYLGQLRECDAFISQLTKTISAYPEPTVIVFYGDHLPSFNFQQEELNNGTTQTTEYVLWANFKVENIDKNLQTYQLGAYVMDFCGIHEGSVFRLHQTSRFGGDDDSEYQNTLSVLEYDILYGKNNSEDSDIFPLMRYDVEEIRILSVEEDSEEENAYYITGTHFTPYSRAALDGDILETEFISDTRLRVSGLEAEEGQLLCVVQISAANEMDILSESEAVIAPVKQEDDHEKAE